MAAHGGSAAACKRRQVEGDQSDQESSTGPDKELDEINLELVRMARKLRREKARRKELEDQVQKLRTRIDHMEWDMADMRMRSEDLLQTAYGIGQTDVGGGEVSGSDQLDAGRSGVGGTDKLDASPLSDSEGDTVEITLNHRPIRKKQVYCPEST